MNKMKFGEMNFNTLVGYLFWINTEFRSTLPGKPPKEDILVETMGSVRNKLWQRLEGKIQESYFILSCNFSSETSSYEEQ